MAFGRTQADIGNTTAIGQSSALDEFLAELRAYPKLLYTRHCLRMAERAVEHAGAVPSHRLQPRAFDNADEERRIQGGLQPDCYRRAASPNVRLSEASCARSRPPGPFYLRIPAANQLPPVLTMSRTGLVQGVGGTGARVPSIRKSPLGSSGTRTESCITPGAGPQNNLARTL